MVRSTIKEPRCIFLFTVIALSAAVCWCGFSCAAETPQPAIRIGVIQSLSGIAAEDGSNAMRALELAAADINLRSSGLLELVVEDDQTAARNAATAFHHLAARGVDAVIAATWDFTTNAVIPLAAREKLVVMNSTTTPEALALGAGEGYVFSNAMSMEEDAEPFARYLRQAKIRSVALIYVTNSWGEIQRQYYRTAADAAGVRVTAELQSSSYENNDWSAIIPRLKVDRPDLVVLLLNKNDIELVLRRAAEMHVAASFFGSKNTYLAFRDSASPKLYDRVCFTYPYARLHEGGAFFQHFVASFGEQPLAYADSSYDALGLLVKAVLRSRSESRPLREALREEQFAGIAGTYRFSEEKSGSTGSSSLTCVKNGILTAQ